MLRYLHGSPMPHDPLAVLVEDTDAVARSRAHTALGRRAMARRDVSQAELHFRQAADLDPTDEVPRQILSELARPAPRRRRLKDWLFSR